MSKPDFETSLLEETTLGRAVEPFSEAITLTMKYRDKGRVATLRVEGSENIFAQTSAIKGPATIYANIPGAKFLEDGFALSSQALSRLARRSWMLDGSDDGVDSYHTRLWEGITTEADQRHVAEEIVSVLTDIYDLSEGRVVTIDVNFDPSDIQ